MRKKSSRRLLDRSCAWIRENWNATNLDVPSELIHQWMYEPEEEGEPSGFHLGVFTFGYLQHQLVSRSAAQSGEKLKVASATLFEHFQKWQLKLALVELHRVTELRMRPLPLFEFPQDEQIECWREEIDISRPAKV